MSKKMSVSTGRYVRKCREPEIDSPHIISPDTIISALLRFYL